MAGRKATVKKKKKQKRSLDPNWLEVTQVAIAVGQSYQSARNMMLRKVFGEPKYEGVPPKMRVEKKQVDVYLQKRAARLAGK